MIPSLLLRGICLSLVLDLGVTAFVQNLPIVNSTSATTVAASRPALSQASYTEASAVSSALGPGYTQQATSAQVTSSSIALVPTAIPPAHTSTSNFTSGIPFAYVPHLESSVTGLRFSKPGQGPQAGITTTASLASVSNPPDVGSFIWSIISATAHIEFSVSGLGAIKPSTTPTAPKQHVESSVAGLNGDEPSTNGISSSAPAVTSTPPVIAGQTLYTTSATKIVVGEFTAKAGQTITIGNGATPTLLEIGPGGKPEYVVGSSTFAVWPVPTSVVTIGGETATAVASGLIIDGQTATQGGSPITIGPGSAPVVVSISSNGDTVIASNGATSTLPAPAVQIFTIGQTTGTVVANAPEYAVGSSVLAVGETLTIGSAIVTITTDSSGSTVVMASGSTTTLPPAQATAGEEPSIATTVVSGTTEYIINSQTLYPGHPITVSDIPISIATSSGSTVLVVGNETTTLGIASQTSSRGSTLTTNVFDGTGWVSASATQSASAKATSGARRGSKSWNILDVGGVIALVVLLGFG